MAKFLDHFIGLGLWPQNVHHLGKVIANQRRNISKHRQRGGVHLPKTEVGINQVNTERRFIEQGLELDAVLALDLFGLLPLGHVARHREQTRRLAAGIKNRRNRHVPPLGLTAQGAEKADEASQPARRRRRDRRMRRTLVVAAFPKIEPRPV